MNRLYREHRRAVLLVAVLLWVVFITVVYQLSKPRDVSALPPGTPALTLEVGALPVT
ncbi:MAG: hypothetical protein HYR48_02345 [Gemmatimonadetes bacterium]|nr:hypothetical protein [Gemmatimonadota bacterium]